MNSILFSVAIAAALAGAPADLVSVTPGVNENYPSLSPDGGSLLFHSSRGDRREIWIAAADGSRPRMLYDGRADGSNPAGPVWSPDGRTIAFAMKPSDATSDEESDIYIMNADGSNVRRLTSFPGDDSHPHWSADGRRIFFNSAKDTPDLKVPWNRQWLDIFSMIIDGSDIRKHSNCRSVCTYGSPSPDGKFVAYRRTTDTLGQNWDLTPGMRNSEVFVGPIDGSAATNVSNSPAYDGWPTWSRDSKWVVFASNRDKFANVGQIYAVRPDGTGMRRLTQGNMSRIQPSLNFAGDQIFVAEGPAANDFEITHIASFPFDSASEK